MLSLVWALIQYDWCPYKRGNLERETRTHGEHHTDMKAEMGVIHHL